MQLSSKSIKGKTAWQCPANIALVKYWGKEAMQKPMNPSLSFTLTDCYTTMGVNYYYDAQQTFHLDFRFNNKSNPAFSERLTRYFKIIAPYMPFLNNTSLKINASNSFPHSAGIASSASSFGALALNLCSIEEAVNGAIYDPGEFFRKASFLARLGSGSAARSVYGGYVLWGATSIDQHSSDEVAVPLSTEISQVFHNLRDSILIVSSAPKPMSSSAGHKLMTDHPYRQARVGQANQNIDHIIKAMQNGKMNDFIEIAEEEALSLHALIQSSSSPVFMVKPNTIAIINHIWNVRKTTGLPVGFTLDAGPNVHVIYPVTIMDKVKAFIEKDLRQYCENGAIIHDKAGGGPVKNE